MKKKQSLIIFLAASIGSALAMDVAEKVRQKDDQCPSGINLPRHTGITKLVIPAEKYWQEELSLSEKMYEEKLEERKQLSWQLKDCLCRLCCFWWYVTPSKNPIRPFGAPVQTNWSEQVYSSIGSFKEDPFTHHCTFDVFERYKDNVVEDGRAPEYECTQMEAFWPGEEERKGASEDSGDFLDVGIKVEGGRTVEFTIMAYDHFSWEKRVRKKRAITFDFFPQDS